METNTGEYLASLSDDIISLNSGLAKEAGIIEPTVKYNTRVLSPAFIEDEVDNCHFLYIKQEYGDNTTNATIKNETASTSNTKSEAQWEHYDMDCSSKATFLQDQDSQLFMVPLSTTDKIETGTTCFGSCDPVSKGFEDFRFEGSVKSENCETVCKVEESPEIVDNEWEIKHEEVNIKQESLENEISMASEWCNQEKYDNHVRKKEIKLTATFYEHSLQPDGVKINSAMRNAPNDKAFFKCDKCDYQTIRKTNLKTHSLEHENSEAVPLVTYFQGHFKLPLQQENSEIHLFRCDNCDFITVRKDSLKIHSLRHKNIEEVDLFRCDKCDFKTIYKKYLKTHSLRHKNFEEVDLLTSDKCDFKTQRNLKIHSFKQKSPEEVRLFRCDKCDYKSIYKGNLKSHSLRHKDLEECDLLTCDKCDFKTVHKKNFKLHSLIHKNPEEVDLLRCDKCHYKTNLKENLKRHCLRHKNPDEVDLFRCDKCDYKTIRKECLKIHFLKHKNLEEVNLFKCDKCDFKTVYKKYLRKHSLRHKNPEELDLFRCDKCNYQTNFKDNLKKHSLRHKNPEDIDLFGCDKCDYKTSHKGTLKMHSLRHRDIEEIDLFRCDECDFKTIHKKSLKMHSLRHTKKK